MSHNSSCRTQHPRSLLSCRRWVLGPSQVAGNGSLAFSCTAVHTSGTVQYQSHNLLLFHRIRLNHQRGDQSKVGNSCCPRLYGFGDDARVDGLGDDDNARAGVVGLMAGWPNSKQQEGSVLSALHAVCYGESGESDDDDDKLGKGGGSLKVDELGTGWKGSCVTAAGNANYSKRELRKGREISKIGRVEYYRRVLESWDRDPVAQSDRDRGNHMLVTVTRSSRQNEGPNSTQVISIARHFDTEWECTVSIKEFVMWWESSIY
ncbi:hypothetical protein DFH09DRAFT_1091278 [Mycena vulgaris]|nr:hypothetical protein DFH09DRAFT_1091278 [Mycena vulgaris]